MSHKATTWAWSQKSISSSAKLVLLALADRHNADNGDCFPSRSRMEADCCMPRTTVKRAIDELETAGLITVIERRDAIGRSKSNQYELHLGNSSVEVNNSKVEGTNMNPLGGHSGPGEGATVDPKPVIDNHRLPTVIKEAADVDGLAEVNNSGNFWDEAVGALLSLGIAETTARQFTGRCLKWAKGDQERIMQAYEAALQQSPRDPIAYISKIINSKNGGADPKKKEIEAALAEIRARMENGPKEWLNDAENDQSGGSGGEDSRVLQHDPFAEPEAIFGGGSGDLDGVQPKSSQRSIRPKGGYLSQMQIPALDS